MILICTSICHSCSLIIFSITRYCHPRLMDIFIFPTVRTSQEISTMLTRLHEPTMPLSTIFQIVDQDLQISTMWPELKAHYAAYYPVTAIKESLRKQIHIHMGIHDHWFLSWHQANMISKLLYSMKQNKTKTRTCSRRVQTLSHQLQLMPPIS